MDSVDKLREWAQKYGPMGAHDPLMIADEIEAEIAANYCELPKDADGLPIRVGDTLECHANGYDGVFDVFAIGTNCVVGNHPECVLVANPFKAMHIASFCTHYHVPTVEDVLREFAQAYSVDEIDWDVRVDVEHLRETAEKLREVLGDV